MTIEMSTHTVTEAPPNTTIDPAIDSAAIPAAASHAERSNEPSGRRAAEDLLAKRRLVVVSNREPYRRVEVDGDTVWQRTTGGLVTALDPVMRRCHGTWIAWEPNSENGEGSREKVPGEPPRFTLRRVPLLRAEVERYYDGMANNALWPLCHYFVDRCHFDQEQWREYVEINRRFADAVVAEAGDDDLVWIHDYHFCLLPELVRERGVRSPIAFFLHIPFPARELFQIFPWRRELLTGLLGADLVGFHSPSYADHFVACCRDLLGAEVDPAGRTIRWQGRTVRAGAFPIGIDVEAFAELAGEPAIAARSEEIREHLQGGKLIFGVDRLDYSKGIPARLHAIDALFEAHPEHRRRVTFVQVAVPSRSRVREYREIKSRIDELIGRINGRHGDAEWQPIRYSNDALPRAELVAHYLAADVALVTPLRDGMNLVALEFCACRPNEDGVLVLSEFAGAAEHLGAGALVVNPFAVHEVAEALHRALTMEPDEQARRMRAAREQVFGNDERRWMESVLAAIAEEVDSWAA
jgi:trehalose 6-phosphate synthase